MDDDLDDPVPRQWLSPARVDALLARNPRVAPAPVPVPVPIAEPASAQPPPRLRPRSAARGGRVWGRTVAAIVVLAIFVWAASGFYKVQPDQVGVVLRFGRLVGTTLPGLNYHLPAPIETVLLPKVTEVNQLKVGNDFVTQMLTGDENIVEATAAVFWRVRDPAKFLFNLQDPEGTVRVIGETAVRQVIGLNPIQAGLSDQRQKIADDAQTLLQQLLDNYDSGILVTQVQLQRVDPPTAVIDAFNDVQRARADEERARNEAEAYARDILPRARGDADRMKQEAEAYRQQTVNAARGDADRFLALYGTYKDAKAVTARRMYLETMEDVLRATNRVVVDPSGHAASVLLPYLPLGNMTGPAPKVAP